MTASEGTTPGEKFPHFHRVAPGEALWTWSLGCHQSHSRKPQLKSRTSTAQTPLCHCHSQGTQSGREEEKPLTAQAAPQGGLRGRVVVSEHAAGVELLPGAAQVLARTGVRSWSPQCQLQRAGAEPGAAGQPRLDLSNTPNMKEGSASSL